MAMFKNVASQKVAVFAWDTSADSEKTGDASNITAVVSLDGAATASVTDTNPTELDATNAPGIYIFDLTQGETNGDMMLVFAKSSTSNVKIEPVVIYTMAVGVGNRVATDAEAISGSTTAADNVEANIGNLDAAISSRSAFNSASDTVDVGKISGSSTAADNVEANIANLDATISSRSTLTSANVNTEMVDVLRTDTMTELSQAAPSATPTMEEAIMLLYMAVRNKLTVTSTEKGFHNDAGTKIAKKTLSDDGTTYTEDEAVSGA